MIVPDVTDASLFGGRVGAEAIDSEALDWLSQLELFPTPEPTQSRIAANRASWEDCWGWTGPKVGGLISFSATCAESITPGGTNTASNSCYVYMTPARVLALTDTTAHVRSVATMWKQVLIKPNRGAPHMGAGTEREPYKLLNGKEFIVTLDQIWPCYKDETISDDGINVVTINIPHPSKQ